VYFSVSFHPGYHHGGYEKMLTASSTSVTQICVMTDLKKYTAFNKLIVSFLLKKMEHTEVQKYFVFMTIPDAIL
jgi:hypothetical protein